MRNQNRGDSLTLSEFAIEAENGVEVYVDIELENVVYSCIPERIRYDAFDHPEEIEFDYKIESIKLSGFDIEVEDLCDFIDDSAFFEAALEVLTRMAEDALGEC